MHYPIMCRDILLFVFWHHIGTICDVIGYLICIIQNRENLEREKISQKGKHRRLSLWKGKRKKNQVIEFSWAVDKTRNMENSEIHRNIPEYAGSWIKTIKISKNIYSQHSSPV